MSHDGPQRDHTASSRRRPRSVPDPDPAPTIMRARRDLGITALKSECHRDSSKSIPAKGHLSPQRDTHLVRTLSPQRDTHSVRNFVWFVACSSSRRRPGSIPDLAPNLMRAEQDRGITTMKSRAPKPKYQKQNTKSKAPKAKHQKQGEAFPPPLVQTTTGEELLLQQREHRLRLLVGLRQHRGRCLRDDLLLRQRLGLGRVVGIQDTAA